MPRRSGLLIPLLTCGLMIEDDLGASALLRAVGVRSHKKAPTSAHTPSNSSRRQVLRTEARPSGICPTLSAS